MGDLRRHIGRDWLSGSGDDDEVLGAKSELETEKELVDEYKEKKPAEESEADQPRT